jgi:flagellin
MALRINTNPSSLNAQRQLAKTTNAKSSSLQKLSSGLRINSASDDAAGLAISEKLKNQVRSTSMAERNANDGISMLQTAEGSLNEISGILVRMRELAVQSSNGTLDSTDRNFLNEEFTALKNEINRISDVTEFNNHKLIDGTYSGSGNGVDFQIGLHASTPSRITREIADMHASAIGQGAASGGGGTPAASVQVADISSVTGSRAAIATLDQALSDTSDNRSDIGATINRLQVTITNLQSSRENLSAANSRIRDVDVASESAKMTKNNILVQAGVSVLAQANQSPQMALNLIG